MKRTYVSPLATEVNIEVKSHILSASFKVVGDEDKAVDTSTPGVQLSNGHRREWGNLWK